MVSWRSKCQLWHWSIPPKDRAAGFICIFIPTRKLTRASVIVSPGILIATYSINKLRSFLCRQFDEAEAASKGRGGPLALGPWSGSEAIAAIASTSM